MKRFNRRKLLASGTTFAAAGLFGSLSAAADEHGESDEESDEDGDRSADFTRPDGAAWRYDGPHNIRSTTVEDDRLYTKSDGTVYAIDTADGTLLWETDGISGDGTPAVDGETVYVVGDRIHALDAETGEIQWESEVESDGMAVDHSMVYTSTEGTVYALDTEDGSVVWERDELTVERESGGETEEDTLESLSMGDTDEDWVYVFDDESWGREVIGLDPATGETGVVVGFIDGVSYVIADSGYLGVQPPYDSTLLIDVPTGENLGGVHPSVGQTFSGGWYFGATRHSTIAAYDLSAGGERAWETEYAQSLPQVVGNTAAVLYGPNSVQHSPEESEDEDRVVAYDLQTGDEQWRYVFDEREWTGGDGPSTALAVDEDTVYVSRHGELLALRSEDDEDEVDEEPEDEEEAGDDPEEETDLDLSVSAPDSVPYEETADPREDAADFCITVTNHGDGTISVDGQFEISPIDEPLLLELEPGETDTVHFGVMSRDLGPGDHDWTVTANGETETGTLTVTDDEEC